MLVAEGAKDEHTPAGPHLDLESSTQMLLNELDPAFVIAHREDTRPLVASLAQEGLAAHVVRDLDEDPSFSYAFGALLNHARAWRTAAERQRPTLVVEADFVPCLGFGEFPVPAPLEREAQGTKRLGIVWLYQCAGRLYSVDGAGWLEGGSTSVVAYLVSPEAAGVLLPWVEEVRRRTGGGQDYLAWDSELDEVLIRAGLTNYLSLRNYGEHGGVPHTEHRRMAFRGRGVHRADVLQGPLVFEPTYAGRGPFRRGRLAAARGRARLWGIGRLLTGRYLRPTIATRSRVPLRLVWAAVRRQLGGAVRLRRSRGRRRASR